MDDDQNPDPIDADDLDSALEAAFEGETGTGAQSVLAQLSQGGRRLQPIRLHGAGAPDPEPAVPVATQGRYQVLGEIARGGVGVVLKSHDVDLGRDVAMKVIREEHAGNEEVVERFIEEAQIGGQLQHPGIVPVYEIGVGAQKKPFFTMKLVKGQTLSALLSERASADDNRHRLMTIFEAVCQTMAYAHARGVIHRDLKPSNVMLGSFGEVLVVDWGMGKVLQAGGVADSRTAMKKADQTVVHTVRSADVGSGSIVGSVMGTPRYMPPEQARGDIDRVDEKSDVFALGAILCEILTGLPPYPGDDAFQQAVGARLDGAYERLDQSGGDAELVEITRACLSPIPDGRPRNAGALAEQIAAHLAQIEERARQAEIEAAEARARAAEDEARAEREHAAAERERQRAERERAEAAHAKRSRRLTTLLTAAAVVLVGLAVGGWMVVDGQARERGRTDDAQVTAALEDATGLRGRAETTNDVRDWEQALAAAERAARLAEGDDVDPSLRSGATTLRVAVAEHTSAVRDHQARLARDRAFVADLEQVTAALADAWQRADACKRYRAVFREHALDVLEASPEEVAAHFEGSQAREDILAALSRWWPAEDDEVRNAHLRAVLDAIDPDPWRVRLRNTWDVAELRTLLTNVDLEAPSASLDLLVAKLGSVDAEAAADLAVRIQATHPDDFWANLSAADRCWRSKQYQRGLPFATAAVALRPDSILGRRALALFLAKSERFEDAVAENRLEIEMAPDAPSGYANLGLALGFLGKHEEALTQLRKALELELDPTKHNIAAIWLGLSISLMETGELADSLAAAQEAYRLNPSDPYVVAGLAGALNASRRHEEALPLVEQAMTLAPSAGDPLLLARILAQLGITHQHLNNPSGAIEAYRRSLSLDPTSVAATVNLSGLIAEVDPAEAKALAERAYRMEPANKMGGAISLANALIVQSPPDVEGIRALVEAHPDSIRIRRYLASALLRTGRVDDAIAMYHELLADNPTEPMALEELSSAYGPHFKASVTGLRKLVDAFPESARVRYYLGWTLLEKNRRKKALDVFRAAIELDPNDREIRQGLSHATMLTGGEPALRELAVEFPTWGEPYFNIGYLYRDGDPRKAITANRDALERSPDMAKAWYNLGRAYSRVLALDDSIDAYRRCLEIDPHYVPALNNLARALHHRADFDDSAEMFLRIIEHDPDDQSAQGGLYQAYWAAGRIEDAVRLLEAWATRPVSPQIAASLAGDIAKTRPSYERVRALPDLPDDFEQLSAPEQQDLVLAALHKGLADVAHHMLIHGTSDLSGDPILWVRFANLAMKAAVGDVDRGSRSPDAWRALALEWLETQVGIWSRHAAPLRTSRLTWLFEQEPLAPTRVASVVNAWPEAERAKWDAFWTKAKDMRSKAAAEWHAELETMR